MQHDTLPKGKVSQMPCPKGAQAADPAGKKMGPACADPLESFGRGCLKGTPHMGVGPLCCKCEIDAARCLFRNRCFARRSDYKSDGGLA